MSQKERSDSHSYNAGQAEKQVQKEMAVRMVGERLPLLAVTSQISMEEGIIDPGVWQVD